MTSKIPDEFRMVRSLRHRLARTEVRAKKLKLLADAQVPDPVVNEIRAAKNHYIALTTCKGT